jgi:hypothetical protein
MSIDIHNNRENIFQLLKTLTPQSQPSWGKMTPQHVVEHLAFSISISNGKGPQKQYTQPEEAEALKGRMIYSEMEMPQGIKNPILGEELPVLKCKDMETALEQLKIELDDFDQLYKTNPETKMIQPRMGPLDHKEWTVLHNKHFTHHFKQFGLI